MKIETDIAVIGSGVAGLQAAIYISRRKRKVVVLGRVENSSLFHSEVENYFGVDSVTSGSSLLNISRLKSIEFGTEFITEDVVNVLRDENGVFQLTMDSGIKVFSKAIIIASGISRKTLGIKGEKEFLGKGVSYCVDCDGMFFSNKVVAITGNGTSAADGALTLVNYVSKLYFIFDELNISDKLLNKIYANDKIQVFDKKKVKEIIGENIVKKIVLDDGNSLDVNGIFIEVGSKAAFELFVNFGLEMDQKTLKHINTNANQETNISGIFAAGDICGLPYQAAKAAGEGCIAGLAATDYIKNNVENK